ncbi:MAG: phenylalanine--tRNA ligase subunit beta, partial [Rickettsiales bacterium]|nr:phenylalanine--tRNA ligase subunit beta [Rickettsiales bacterium]
MKFTLKWLKEFLDTEATASEIADKLTKIGLEIEDVVDNAFNLRGFDCVFVEEATKHPESDHLNVCKVTTAKGGNLQIICGASNMKTGIKCVLAPVGSIIPSTNLRLSKSKIRGLESQGMICSEKELGLGNDHGGILVLPVDTPLGKNIAEIKGLDDVVFDMSITPNRGDCLGVYGIARALSATGIGNLKEFKYSVVNETIENPYNIRIDDDNCSEFSVRYIKNVKNCESPDWLKNRLISAGFTPKTTLVDITNYVMWVLNRPLHCYDADKVKDFVIKKSVGGEKFLALDKKEYVLPADATLISNSNGEIMGLGGIIGGMETATEITTTNIVLESAIFEPMSIAKTSRALNIITDSKFRFERDIDFAITKLASDYATSLILEICGGEASNINVVTTKRKEKTRIDFLLSDIPLVLGMDIEFDKIMEILTRLGYEITIKDNNISVVVPTWRSDITIKENVIEDVIRFYGYDNLKPIPITEEKIGEDEINKENRLKSEKIFESHRILASNGLMEVITYSFINEKKAGEFAPINEELKLLNPISSDMTYMRPSLIPGLLNVVKYNVSNGIDKVDIFENGIVFFGIGPTEQKQVLAGVRYGSNIERDVFKTSRMQDIYDVKKDLFDVLVNFNINADNLVITNDFPDYYHPSKSGAVKMGNLIVGVFGELHPFKSA